MYGTTNMADKKAFAADIGPGNKADHGPAIFDGDGAGSQEITIVFSKGL